MGGNKVFWNLKYFDDNKKLDSKIYYTVFLYDYLSIFKISTVRTQTLSKREDNSLWFIIRFIYENQGYPSIFKLHPLSYDADN